MTKPESVFSNKVGRGLANYPHAKKVGSMLYLSGISSRQSDESVRGVTITDGGEIVLSISEQTEGVIQKYITNLIQS